jgi:hypothetical protein
MIGSVSGQDLLMNSYKYTLPDILRYFKTVAKLLLFDLLMLMSD